MCSSVFQISLVCHTFIFLARSYMQHIEIIVPKKVLRLKTWVFYAVIVFFNRRQ